MAVLVPCLVQLRDEFNTLAPNRDKASDGWIGDSRHAARPSDHNPDESGRPEVHDPDDVDEVHAIDVDRDLRHPSVTMEEAVAFLVARCRAGRERRLRYIIYNRTIWSASSGWVARRYTGDNPHTSHAHFSASYEAKLEADRRSWGLSELVSPGSGGGYRPGLVVDGVLGPRTISAWQRIMGTPVDGRISPRSALVRAVQRHLNSKIGAGLAVDGVGASIRQDGRTRTHTHRALQRYLGTPQDGILSVPASMAVRALQRRLNSGRF